MLQSVVGKTDLSEVSVMCSLGSVNVRIMYILFSSGTN